MRGLVSIVLIFIVGCTSAPKYAIDSPPSIKPAIKIATQWVAHAGEKYSRAQNQLPPNVVDNKIYLANNGGDVGVMELDHGKVLWQSDLHERIAAGPGYGDGVLVVANDKAEVIALQDGSGTVLWRQKVSSEVLAQPLVYNDKVYVQTVDGKIFALAKANGKKLWVDSREIPPLTLRGTSKPIIIKDKLLVGYATGELVAYNLDSGKVLWETAIGVPKGRTDLERIVDIDGLFAGNDDTLYVACYQGKIAAVDLAEGRLIWNREMSSFAGLTIDENQIYVTDSGSYVWALDKNSGATLWRQEKLANRYLTTPVILQNTVVVADVGGYVFWLSKEDGDILAQVSFYRTYLSSFVHWSDDNLQDKDYGVTTYMSVEDNRLLVRDNEGTLAMFMIIKEG